MPIIARYLNERGFVTTRGSPFLKSSVRHILTNERFAGVQTYNRTTRKLKRESRPNSPDQWVRAACSFEPIISPKLFAQAQETLRANRWNGPDEDLLKLLKGAWQEHGAFTTRIVNDSPMLLSVRTFHDRFGGLRSAYRLIGYSSLRNQPGDWRATGHRHMETKIAEQYFRSLRAIGRQRGFEWVADHYVLRFDRGPIVRVLVLRS